MKKGLTFLVLGAIFFGGVVLLVVQYKERSLEFRPVSSPQSTPVPQDFIPSDKGISIKFPKEAAMVVSPFEIQGTIYGNGWSAFEGVAGTAELLDASGRRIASVPLYTNGEWMQLPVDFSAKMVFPKGVSGEATLVFHNENASGNPSLDRTLRLPVDLISSQEDVSEE